MTFDSFLDPRIPGDDAERLARQTAKILALFVAAYRSGGCVTTAEMAAIGRQYNARLYEVRRFLVAWGFCIDLVGRIPGSGINRYRMVPLGESKFYKAHKDQLDGQCSRSSEEQSNHDDREAM